MSSRTPPRQPSPERVDQAPRESILAERAYALLATTGTPLAEADLVRHVFGTHSAALWASLLGQVLGDDPRFVRTDGGWELAHLARVEPTAPREIVAVAIATTGADPRRHRIVRLAATRSAQGVVAGRLDLVLNPRRRLPAYLSAAARVSQDAADDAPEFPEVIAAIREFVAAAPIAAYGVRWVRDFLDAECRRIDAPPLINHCLELDELARRVGLAGRKPSLRSLAEQLAIPHARPNHPPADADAAARVTWALLARSDERPADPIRPGSTASPPEPVAAPAPRALLDRRWLADVAEAPGVYTILDAEQAPLYVGKSANLRRRLATYLGRSFALHRQLEALAIRAVSVRVDVCPSDLEARLLEARLIRQHDPPFNVVRSQRPRALQIRATPSAATPRLQLAQQAGHDGSLYLGPFPSERAARSALTLARAVYPDACSRRRVDPAAQRQAVHQAVRLLTGHKGEAIAELRARMQASGARADHLAVGRARRLLRAVLEFEIRSSPLLGLSWDEELLVVEAPDSNGARRAHLIRGGRLLASTSLAPEADIAEPRRTLALVANLRTAPTEPHDDADAPIVLQWLGESDERRSILPLSQLRRAADHGAFGPNPT